jgi:hypothetical protein
MKAHGEVNVKLHLILTSAPDGDEWSALPSEKDSLVSNAYEAGWAPVSVWTPWRREKYLPLPGL